MNYNHPMRSGADPTDSYVRLLTACAAAHGLIAESELRAIDESPGSCNPLDSSARSDNPELRFAMNQAFDRLLTSGLDWIRVRIAARTIAEQLEEQRQDRFAASLQTRWLPLENGSPFFDVVRWEAAWSRRDLEAVLGFFADDAFYLDATRNLHAQGKRDIRRLLSRLFHASDGVTVVSSVKFVPAESEIELEWVQ